MLPTTFSPTREALSALCVTVIAAHPDDEVIGLGGLLPQLHHATVVHVSDGAPHERRWWGAPELPSREDYARVRRLELINALSIAGITEDRMRSLGVIDQEVSHDLVGLATRMAEILAELHCDVVFTHPYEGGHPDHDATAFAVHAACKILHRNGQIPPRIVEFTSYHARPDGGTAVCEFLPDGGPEETEIALGRAEQDLKRQMIASFVTQRETLAWFPVDMDAERFRISPSYDFTAPPHPGKLHYERFEWGWTGDEWRAHAREALQDMKMEAGADAGAGC